MKPLKTAQVLAFSAILTLAIIPAMAQNATDALDPRVRELVQREMSEIESAMHTILSAIVRGQHDMVQEQAQAIHDSFILARSLSDEDRQALRTALPNGFVEMDRAFHDMADALSASGTEQDSAAQLDFFQQMTEACLRCHQTYATERFSGLTR